MGHVAHAGIAKEQLPDRLCNLSRRRRSARRGRRRGRRRPSSSSVVRRRRPSSSSVVRLSVRPSARPSRADTVGAIMSAAASSSPE